MSRVDVRSQSLDLRANTRNPLICRASGSDSQLVRRALQAWLVSRVCSRWGFFRASTAYVNLLWLLGAFDLLTFLELAVFVGDTHLTAALVGDDLARTLYRLGLGVSMSACALVVLFDDVPATALLVRDDIAIGVVTGSLSGITWSPDRF
jgi:hypothetical protein